MCLLPEVFLIDTVLPSFATSQPSRFHPKHYKQTKPRKRAFFFFLGTKYNAANGYND